MRAPTKMELAGLAMMAVGVAAYFLDGAEAAHDWKHGAGIGGWTLTGVVLFVGKGSIDMLRSVASLPGYARREWKRRQTAAVPIICPKCKKEMFFCECPE